MMSVDCGDITIEILVRVAPFETRRQCNVAIFYRLDHRRNSAVGRTPFYSWSDKRGHRYHMQCGEWCQRVRLFSEHNRLPA